MFSHKNLAILYCLNADRFPWAQAGRKISLLACARFMAREAVNLIKRRKPNKDNK